MRQLIDWFADNPIAANLLMMILLIGGLTGLGSLDKEMFPPFTQDVVRISVSYPGAGPREVEQQVCVRIEEALEGLEGIKELRCTASLNRGTADVEVASGFTFDRILNAVKSRVDSISTFPADTERPIVEELRFSQRVIGIAVSGDADERSIKELAESIRSELSGLPNIPLVEISGTRPYELAIEVPEARLREYGLDLQSLANRIAGHSITVAGGLIRTATGDIQIQVREQGYTGNDFASIPVISNSDGSHVLLGDIADIRDGFVEDESLVRFNGQRAAFLDVVVTENPDILVTTKEVYRFVEERRLTLPAEVSLTIWQDQSVYFKDRLATLQRNGLMGLSLVFILLLLFLRPALAFWVAVGIATSFVATLFVLPAINTSLNVITLFAFILVLGIVVDDAIIIGENVHRIQTRGTWGVEGSKLGTNEMAAPVFFAVITSVIVFLPMLFLPGDFAAFMGPIATIPIIALLFSLLESLLILPAHLSHLKPEKKARFVPQLAALRESISRGMDLFLVTAYRPFVRKCLHYRFLTIACFCAGFLIILSIFLGGWVRYSPLPNVPVEYVRSSVRMPAGTPFHQIEDVAAHTEAAARRAIAAIEKNEGEQILKNLFVTGSGNFVETIVELTSAQTRQTSSAEFVRLFEREIGELPMAEELTISGSIDFGGSANIEFKLEGRSLDELTLASDWVKSALESYADTYNVRDSLSAGRPEMEIVPRALAATLGVSPADLAQQMRQVFFGAEIQRIPRFREDVRVMLRYPQEERSSTQLLDTLRIRTADQREVPFNSLADTRFVEGFASITRIDRSSTITVSADYADDANLSAETIVDDFFANKLPEFQRIYPHVRISLQGEQLENRDFMSALVRLGTLALVAIYGLLAIQFRSLSQPFIILASVPFGFAGAIVAHLITGQSISLLSMMGVLAAAGVVVNDTLVLISRANALRALGFSASHAVIQAGRDRFRPIFLTSITTFAGLAPLMLEKSTQAQFLIPMATSLSSGVLAATVVTLVMVPCLYTLNEDLSDRIRGKRANRAVIA